MICPIVEVSPVLDDMMACPVEKGYVRIALFHQISAEMMDRREFVIVVDCDILWKQLTQQFDPTVTSVYATAFDPVPFTFVGRFRLIEEVDAPCGFTFELEYVILLVGHCPTYEIWGDGKTEIEIGMAIADTSIGIVSTVCIAILGYRITFLFSKKG